MYRGQGEMPCSVETTDSSRGREGIEATSENNAHTQGRVGHMVQTTRSSGGARTTATTYHSTFLHLQHLLHLLHLIRLLRPLDRLHLHLLHLHLHLHLYYYWQYVVRTEIRIRCRPVFFPDQTAYKPREGKNRTIR